MLIYNVFGRHIGARREDGRWLVFLVDLTERKFFRLYDISIPDDMTETEIAGWLGDIFHEAATERHPDVKQIIKCIESDLEKSDCQCQDFSVYGCKHNHERQPTASDENQKAGGLSGFLYVSQDM